MLKGCRTLWNLQICKCITSHLLYRFFLQFAVNEVHPSIQEPTGLERTPILTCVITLLSLQVLRRSTQGSFLGLCHNRFLWSPGPLKHSLDWSLQLWCSCPAYKSSPESARDCPTPVIDNDWLPVKAPYMVEHDLSLHHIILFYMWATNSCQFNRRFEVIQSLQIVATVSNSGSASAHCMRNAPQDRLTRSRMLSKAVTEQPGCSSNPQ